MYAETLKLQRKVLMASNPNVRRTASVVAVLASIISTSVALAEVEYRWTQTYGQGTTEAAIQSKDGSSLHIYCAEGGDGFAGVILLGLGSKLKGNHLLQVVVDGRSTQVGLENGTMKGGWREGNNEIFSLVRALLNTKAKSFTAELPDLGLSEVFSTLNVRDALTFANPNTHKRDWIVSSCLARM